jgi:hypothetical protein
MYVHAHVCMRDGCMYVCACDVCTGDGCMNVCACACMHSRRMHGCMCMRMYACVADACMYVHAVYARVTDA